MYTRLVFDACFFLLERVFPVFQTIYQEGRSLGANRDLPSFWETCEVSGIVHDPDRKTTCVRDGNSYQINIIYIYWYIIYTGYIYIYIYMVLILILIVKKKHDHSRKTGLPGFQIAVGLTSGLYSMFPTCISKSILAQESSSWGSKARSGIC